MKLKAQERIRRGAPKIENEEEEEEEGMEARGEVWVRI